MITFTPTCFKIKIFSKMSTTQTGKTFHLKSPSTLNSGGKLALGAKSFTFRCQLLNKEYLKCYSAMLPLNAFFLTDFSILYVL